MTRKELYESFYGAALPVYGEREASSIAYFLMDGLYSVSRLDVIMEPAVAVELREDHQRTLSEIGASRPPQYITGRTMFCGLEFAVAEGVLIPRPETEELVEWVAEESGNIRLLDIGTGSGAIAVALARRLQEADVTALDVSAAALKIASGNARANHADIRFVHGDALSGREMEELFGQGKFDVIVSNPPYIPQREKNDMKENVTGYEPSLALFVDDADPLLFYRAIAQAGLAILKPYGRIYVEIHEDFAQETAGMFSGMGYEQVEVRKDIHGKNRMVRCVRG